MQKIFPHIAIFTLRKRHFDFSLLSIFFAPKRAPKLCMPKRKGLLHNQDGYASTFYSKFVLYCLVKKNKQQAHKNSLRICVLYLYNSKKNVGAISSCHPQKILILACYYTKSVSETKANSSLLNKYKSSF